MKNTKILLGLILVVLFAEQIFGQQGVSISTDNSTPHESAMLEIKSNGKGLLIPRMNVLERMNIQNPAEGLLLYQTNDVKGFYYFDGTEWHHFYSTAEISSIGSGNIITDAERTILNSAMQDLSTNSITELSDVTNAGSGQIITQTERDKINSLQNNPAGTILVFAGETLPEGYLWCDGKPYLRTEYPNLFTAIDENWGAGDGSNTFNIPDLRGQFLRGMDRDNGSGLANNDPDIADRTDIEGNTVGNIIGSLQDDQFKSHNHDLFAYQNYTGSGGQRYFRQISDASYVEHNYTANSGGSETRPKNAYVNYIIKY